MNCETFLNPLLVGRVLPLPFLSSPGSKLKRIMYLDLQELNVKTYFYPIKLVGCQLNRGLLLLARRTILNITYLVYKYIVHRNIKVVYRTKRLSSM